MRHIKRRLKEQTELTMKQFTVVFGVVILALVSQAQDYCYTELCNNSPLARHIDCNNNGVLADRCPKNIQIVEGYTKRDLILSLVNSYRSRLGLGTQGSFPPSVRMGVVAWSPDLARLAALTIKRCALEKDECRNTYTFRDVGQLFFHQSSTEKNIEYTPHLTDMINYWWNQNAHATVDDINFYSPGTRPDASDISGFVQLALDKLTHMGCATAAMTKFNRLDVYSFCNFSQRPAGRIYVSSCQPTESCVVPPVLEYPGLCGPGELINGFATQTSNTSSLSAANDTKILFRAPLIGV